MRCFFSPLGNLKVLWNLWHKGVLAKMSNIESFYLVWALGYYYEYSRKIFIALSLDFVLY